jgi:hypothetical protein
MPKLKTAKKTELDKVKWIEDLKIAARTCETLSIMALSSPMHYSFKLAHELLLEEIESHS